MTQRREGDCDGCSDDAVEKQLWWNFCPNDKK